MEGILSSAKALNLQKWEYEDEMDYPSFQLMRLLDNLSNLQENVREFETIVNRQRELAEINSLVSSSELGTQFRSFFDFQEKEAQLNSNNRATFRKSGQELVGISGLFTVNKMDILEDIFSWIFWLQFFSLNERMNRRGRCFYRSFYLHFDLFRSRSKSVRLI
jgi:hypothetical protein